MEELETRERCVPVALLGLGSAVVLFFLAFVRGRVLGWGFCGRHPLLRYLHRVCVCVHSAVSVYVCIVQCVHRGDLPSSAW